jgi:hypothetical protein
MKPEAYEIIDGKPYIGQWYGKSCILLDTWRPGHPAFEWNLKRLKFVPLDWPLIIKDDQVIYKPPIGYDGPLSLRATLAYKFMVWGRAYLVKKMLRKRSGHSKRKKWVNNKRVLA